MKPSFRVGLGFDFHPFQQGRELILGGIRIPHPVGLAGHSDADVVLHAISDAILGAAGLGDIGHHFPDSDPRYKGISSVHLLTRVVELVQVKGWAIGNVDIVIVAEEPRIAPFREAISAKLSEVLEILPGEVCVKATTMEGMGPVGRKEGISAQAVVLLYRG